MEYGFVIAGVFLAIGIGLGVYIGIYKITYLDPLAEAQEELIHEMNCEEILEYHANAYWWSTNNRLFADDTVKTCQGDDYVAPTGH